jgi:hypothetical protein
MDNQPSSDAAKMAADIRRYRGEPPTSAGSVIYETGCTPDGVMLIDGRPTRSKYAAELLQEAARLANHQPQRRTA